MNIFFYTSTWSVAANSYLKRLNGLAHMSEIKNILSGSLFLSPLALQLRSGDLLILFAGNTKELDELFALKNEFNEFRVILILSDGDCLPKAHSLRPCFIAFQDAKMAEIESVIHKITGKDRLLSQAYEA